ncbi:MAG: hypothetical protein NVSMB10_11980 [Steroidobacteraceae bacterium]
MAAELRWILAALFVLLFGGIWWWSARRSRQAPGNSQLRESTLGSAVAAQRAMPVGESAGPPLEPTNRDWGVSPLEPLSIRTAEFEPVQIADLPMTAHPDTLDDAIDFGSAHAAPAPEEPHAMAAEPEPSSWPTNDAAADRLPAEPQFECRREPTIEPPIEEHFAAEETLHEPPSALSPHAPSTEPASPIETQRIVSVRVSAAGKARWNGTDLAAVLEHNGMTFGRYQVFHRKRVDGQTLFCAASLIEPGTFNLSRMPYEEFPGLTLFAVLPGPGEPVDTLDELIETAVSIAETFQGTLQDGGGLPLTPQRAEALRDDVARFQSTLTMN